MTRILLLLALLLLWPSAAHAQSPPHTERMYDAMTWCLPQNAVPIGPAHVSGGEEWLRIDADGLDFALMWLPRPTSLNFTTIPHHAEPRLRVAIPNHFARFDGQSSMSQDDLDLSRVFMLMTVGCFSMTPVTDAS